jgi:hypothetical protein
VLENKPVQVSGNDAMLAVLAIEAVVKSYETNKLVNLV